MALTGLALERSALGWPGRSAYAVSIRSVVTRIGSFVARTARAVKIVIRHGGVPRPIRWLAAVGLLPVPGPFDEAVLLLVALILFAFYRAQLREAGLRPPFAKAARSRPPHPQRLTMPLSRK